MTVSKEFINDKLNKAQQLLWGGSETENIAAHNIIAELIKDLQDE
jgi:tetrahydromethanopterin S-methyltransferase subunit A